MEKPHLSIDSGSFYQQMPQKFDKNQDSLDKQLSGSDL